MNGSTLNVAMEGWQIERISEWLRENDAVSGSDVFLIAMPLVREERLEIVGWIGDAAGDAHRTFRAALLMHFPAANDTDDYQLDAHQRGQLYGHKCPACSGGA